MQASSQNKLLLTLGISPVMRTFGPSILASWVASPLLTLAGTVRALEVGAYIGHIYGIVDIVSYRQEVWDAVFVPLWLRGVVSWKENEGWREVSCGTYVVSSPTHTPMHLLRLPLILYAFVSSSPWYSWLLSCVSRRLPQDGIQSCQREVSPRLSRQVPRKLAGHLRWLGVFSIVVETTIETINNDKRDVDEMEVNVRWFTIAIGR